MRIHHLNCGTMNMPGYPMVAHVFLLETDRGLVLVDSGFGLHDIENPKLRVGPMRHVIRPVFDPDETAVRQIARLGFRPNDVRHIVLTHLDMDHAGGIADFPNARIHTTAAELLGAVVAPNIRARTRYRAAQFTHGPTWIEHTPDGEAWFGFAAAKELTSISPGLVLVSLPGHSPGHACVAVDTDGGWLLHAGDAFYHWGALGGPAPVPPQVKLMERVAATNFNRLVANQRRLAELHHGTESVRVISAHDPADLIALTKHAANNEESGVMR
ncbi:MBL fold metallo-hydrolase [Rhodococcus sp. T2V]|uniref:MBL fold metallo-hydrolase n=1 Tax=Rhodococcus sp. T2V TaxID=3034164 RepID=UPI0023E23515|nr:MBL fold metallo-hydrolase [Rhodococcus sp. T2V]MDF3309702.1 MBL fold metallo-hydrolase [Rhodococcus sp. T2V]